MSRLLTDEEITRQLSELPGWSVVDGEGPSAVRATFDLVDFRSALHFVQQVGDVAEQLDHHPDIDIRYNRVTLVLSTHSEGGLTQQDIELAHRVSSETGVSG